MYNVIIMIVVFNSKKHKCPVHYHLTPQSDPSLLPKSEYRTIYCNNQKDQSPSQIQVSGPQRGIKLYPRILPSYPKTRLESTTNYERSFPNPGPQKVCESFKPQEYYVKSDAKFYDETSYKAEFPKIPLPSLPPEGESLISDEEPLVLPTVPNKPTYETSHRRFFPCWKDIGKCRPLPYGEPHEEPFFTGTFSGETVTMSEFPSKVAEPRSPCYPKEKQHIREGKFSDKTTTMEDTFTLPCLVGNEREGPFLKNKSKKGEESNAPIKEYKHRPTNKILTQYQSDNQPYHIMGHQPEKRKMKLPHPETISLSMSCNKLPQIATVQKLAYPDWGPQEIPSLLKREDETEVLTGPFNDITEYNTEYVPKPQVTNVEFNEEDKKLELRERKSGKKTFKQQKQVINFNKVPFPASVNQSDYFKFTKTHPRYRHGDKSERLYCGPSSAKFGCLTKYQLDFPPKAPQGPTQCYKPVHKLIANDKFEGDTSYNEHYPVRPLPIRSACPGGQLLLLQPFY